MGRRGPPKTPTKILEQQGSRRAKERKGEPQPKAATPDPPSWLSTNAKAVWRQVAKELLVLSILTTIDRNTLARYCVLWVRWRRAEDVLESEGMTYETETKSGSIILQRPEVTIAKALAAELLKVEREFGMTPGSRASIKVEGPAQEDDPLVALMKSRANQN